METFWTRWRGGWARASPTLSSARERWIERGALRTRAENGFGIVVAGSMRVG
jgi:hypothetical protein